MNSRCNFILDIGVCFATQNLTFEKIDVMSDWIISSGVAPPKLDQMDGWKTTLVTFP